MCSKITIKGLGDKTREPSIEVFFVPMRYVIREGAHPHFVTSSVVYWIPVFSIDHYTEVLINSLSFCVREKGLLIHAYVVMPSHFHVICSQTDGHISKVLRSLKTFTSKRIAEILEKDARTEWLNAMKSAGAKRRAEIKVWQDEFHPEEIRSEQFFNQKLNYIHNNPVRAGHIEDPDEWKYSSAGFYYRNRESLVPIEPIMW
jgi:putative transposase